MFFRNSLLLSLSLVIVLLSGTVSCAADPLSLVPDSALVLVKIRPQVFFPFEKIKDPALSQKLTKIFSTMKEKSGIDFPKDITEITAFMTEINFPSIAMGSPLDAVIIINGNFDLKGIEERISRKKEPGVKMEKVGKTNTYTVDDTSFVPFARDTLVIGPAGMIRTMLEGQKTKKLKEKKEWADLVNKGGFSEATFFMAALLPDSMRNMIEGLKDPKARVFASLENICLSYEGQQALLTLKFKDRAGAQAAMVVLEEGLREARAGVEKNRLEREFPEEILERAKEVRVMKAGMELGDSLVKGTELSINDNQITAKISTGSFKDNMDLVIEDWLLNMADLFIEKPASGKPSAGASDPQRELCEANMCMLEGASDLYLMDQTVEVNVVKLEELVKDEYIRKSPECPSGGQYTITVTGSGPRVSCSRHGELR